MKKRFLFPPLLEKIFDGESIEKKKIIQQLNSKLETIETRKKRIRDDYMDGKLKSGEYQELKMELDKQSFEINNTLTE